jgi:hypothetical protein
MKGKSMPLKKRTIQEIKKALIILLCASVLLFAACSQRSVERGAQGAATGAVVGAVGGLVSGLVFGGDVAESTARGAVYGGATGAAAGAISGAAADSNQKKAQQAAELEALRKTLGDDAYQGLEALANCKHDIAQGYGRTAAKSSNEGYALAGLWVQVLTYADSQDMDSARKLFPDLIEKDTTISSESQAEAETQNALKELKEIRKRHNLPQTCG